MVFNKNNSLTFYLYSFLLFVICQNFVFSSSEIEKQQNNLKNLRSKIASIQANIEDDIGFKQKFISDLRLLDKSISKHSKKIRRLNLKQKTLNIKSNQLKRKLKLLLKSLTIHKKVLSKQIVSTYKVGQQQALQIVLNQKSVDSISRMLTYAKYLNSARSKQINRTKTLSTQIKDAVFKLELQQSELKDNQLLLEKNKIAYSNTYSKRKKLLKIISQKLIAKQQNLNSLENDSHRLQRLVKSLSEILYDIPAPPQELLPFYKLKGKLVSPVKGKIIHRFRETKNNKRMRWKGIVLKTKRGLNVKAVHSGRVVFSDWLNGFGNIVIIDHGGGYLSLYAYNQSLEKDIGEWVVKGDIVATTGKSGGQKQNALYFEIRKKGKPVNPLLWIKKS